MHPTISPSMARIRAAFPSLRRTGPTAIVHSGAKATVFGCLCGSAHSTSTDWHGRAARHVTAWQLEHAGCDEAIAAALDAPDHVATCGTWRGYVGRARVSMPVVQVRRDADRARRIAATEKAIALADAAYSR